MLLQSVWESTSVLYPVGGRRGLREVTRASEGPRHRGHTYDWQASLPSKTGELIEVWILSSFRPAFSLQGYVSPYWLSCGSPWRPLCVKPLKFWESLFLCCLLDELQHTLWFSPLFFSFIESSLIFQTELITKPPLGTGCNVYHATAVVPVKIAFLWVVFPITPWSPKGRNLVKFISVIFNLWLEAIMSILNRHSGSDLKCLAEDLPAFRRTWLRKWST